MASVCCAGRMRFHRRPARRYGAELGKNPPTEVKKLFERYLLAKKQR
jgi:hypothetical protein